MDGGNVVTRHRWPDRRIRPGIVAVLSMVAQLAIEVKDLKEGKHT